MAKIRITMSRSKDEEAPEVVSVAFKPTGNKPAARFKELMEWVKTQASIGTGITLTFTNNGGEKKTMYIDGDGSDRIVEVV